MRNPGEWAQWLCALKPGDTVIVRNYNARLPELESVLATVERVSERGHVVVKFDVPASVKLPTDRFINGMNQASNSRLEPATPEDVAALREKQQAAVLARRAMNFFREPSNVRQLTSSQLTAILTIANVN